MGVLFCFVLVNILESKYIYLLTSVFFLKFLWLAKWVTEKSRRDKLPIFDMDMLPLAHHLFVLVFLIFLFKTVDAQLSNFEDSDEPLRICKYERFSEVKRECSSFLSSASELKLEKEKAYEIATELSFVNGDWVQEAGGAPLMPFDDSDMPRNFSSPGSLLKLASFWMMGIDFSRQLENAINICGYLSIAITRNSTLSNRPESWTPLFFKRPGVSELRIPFEGLYMESEENEGERLMCLLGTSIPPFSEGSSDPLKSSMPYRSRCNDQFSLLMDDRIMLVLRFPKRYTLTNRAIYGEMRSLNENSNPNYFDRVHMSSQLGFNSKYLFGSEMVVSKARDLYPDQHELIDNGVKFEALQFCKLFRMFDGETFDIVENQGLKCRKISAIFRRNIAYRSAPTRYSSPIIGRRIFR